jgi:SAM-dependent MidA family methyltransferase
MDITSFVDFTAVAEAAEAEGLETLAFMNQAGFLLANGILQRLEERAEPGSLAYLKAARALQRLIMPHEMGELFKVIALGRGIEPPAWE